MDASVQPVMPGCFSDDSQCIEHEAIAGLTLAAKIQFIATILLAILGILGNSLVLVVLFRIKELRTIPNALIANQSIVDLLASAFLILRMIEYVTPVSPIETYLACVFLSENLLFWSAMVASTFNLVMMSAERYLAVVYPIRYRAHATFRRAWCAACVPWLLGLVATFQLFFTVRVGTSGECEWTLTSTGKAILGAGTFLTQFIFPLGCMVVAYIRIFITLRKKFNSELARHTRVAANVSQGDAKKPEVGATRGNNDNATNINMRGSNHSNTAQDVFCNSGTPEDILNTITIGIIDSRRKERAAVHLPYRDRARRNIISTVLVVFLTFVVCWTPNHILYLVHNLGGPIDFDDALYVFSVIPAFCNIFVNPFIYTFKYRRFRKGLKKLCFKERSKPCLKTPVITIIESPAQAQQ